FNRDLIQKNEIQFAIFNPHKTLKTGKWYWQYKVGNGNWNPVDSFVITGSTPKFETPEIEKLLSAIPETHPRVLVRKTDLGDLRERAKKYNESVIIINEANKYLNQPPPKEESLLPTFTGKNDFENSKIALLASKTSGGYILKVL